MSPVLVFAPPKLKNDGPTILSGCEPPSEPLTVSGFDEMFDHVWLAPSVTFALMLCAPVPGCTVMPPLPSVMALLPPTVTGALAPLAKFSPRTDTSAPSVAVIGALLLLK